MAVPPDDATLREAARARGFRLVKSRRRKPGGDHGRYGLTDLDTGRECLGFGANGLTATPDEILTSRSSRAKSRGARPTSSAENPHRRS